MILRRLGGSTGRNGSPTTLAEPLRTLDMKTLTHVLVLSCFALAATFAAADELDDAFVSVETFESEKDAEPLKLIEAAVIEGLNGTPEARSAIEDRLIAALEGATTRRKAVRLAEDDRGPRAKPLHRPREDGGIRLRRRRGVQPRPTRAPRSPSASAGRRVMATAKIAAADGGATNRGNRVTASVRRT